MGTRHGRSTPKETACSSRIVGGVGGLRAVYVLAWAALAGCAQAPSAVPPSGSGAPVDGVGVTGEPETWDDVLAVEAERLGIDDPPDVVPIRYVTPQEADRYYHECMAEQGWKAEPDGSYVSTEEQAEAINLSDYVCLASYPIPAEYLQPLTHHSPTTNGPTSTTIGSRPHFRVLPSTDSKSEMSLPEPRSSALPTTGIPSVPSQIMRWRQRSSRRGRRSL